MIKNYWKNICRNLIRPKSYSSPNIFGSLLCITCGISMIMNYKKVISNIVMLTALFACLYISYGCRSSQAGGGVISAGAMDSGKCPETIYYALNESHSNSWVQRSADGVVGIVYGQRIGMEAGNNIGQLVYKTILPNGSEKEEVVTTGRGVDKCVLLYDSNSCPHIFFACSDNLHQAIFHLYKKDGSTWHKEIAINFSNISGKFIYELSADIDKKNSFHLLALKTRFNPQSKDYYPAYRDCRLFYVTNAGGNWEKKLIHRYDTFYTYDYHVKVQRRQDIAVDNDGFAHVVFGVQLNPLGQGHDATGQLYYASNKTGKWVIELALKPSKVPDDAGWFPSLCLDKTGRPAVAYTYVSRVRTRSASNTRLCYAVRSDKNRWETAVVADSDDGYDGNDGRGYTGALPHLKIDDNNTPHMVFSDIASSHRPKNVFNIGQIRYAVFNGSSWDISTIYRQSPPKGFYNAREIAGQCLVISGDGKKIQVVAQEMISRRKNVYTHKLVYFVIK